MTDIFNKMIFVTGGTGFIGSNLILELLRSNIAAQIIGIDNMNDYYDVSIKEWRLAEIEKCAKEHLDSSWTFIKGSIADKILVDQIFEEHKPDIVVNLAAQAGVRYSITNPDVYVESNLIGFYNLLEACRHSYDDGAKGLNILYMLLIHRYMAQTRKCLIQQMIKWITQYRYMQLPRNPMN